MNKHGMSLLEILVAAVIMALVMAGLANVFLAGKQFILHSRSRIGAAEIGRYFMDPLQHQVRLDRWGDNCVGSGNCLPGSYPVNGILYNVTYSVTNVTATANLNLRRVIANITWAEPAP